MFSINRDFDIIEGEKVYLRNRYIARGRYLLEERLGSGAHGVVFLASDFSPPPNSDDTQDPGSKGPDKVAVKVLLDRTLPQQCKNDREFYHHRRATRDMKVGVVPLRDRVKEDGLVYLIMEYRPQGDLRHLITSNPRNLMQDKRFIWCAYVGLLKTIAKLHLVGLFHRDLKPENIFLHISNAGECQLQISDFGLATDKEYTSQACGTIRYMPPECFDGSPRVSSRVADTWALGIILVNLLFWCDPWGKAVPSDEVYLRYMRDPRSLFEQHPFSEQAFQFVNHIFSTGGRTEQLLCLYWKFKGIHTLFMTEEECKVAHETGRSVALDRLKQLDNPATFSRGTIEDATSKRRRKDNACNRSSSVTLLISDGSCGTWTTSGSGSPGMRRVGIWVNKLADLLTRRR